MSSKKKVIPLKKKTLAPGVYRVVAGKAFARRPYVQAALGSLLQYQEAFEERLAEHEREAIAILTNAGLPTDASATYSIPKGKVVDFPLMKGFGVPNLKVGFLPMLVVAKGYRQLESPEWFAAMILMKIYLIREGMFGTSSLSSGRTFLTQEVRSLIGRPLLAQLSCELGVLVTELRALVSYPKTGRMGGSRKRPPHPVVLLVQAMLRRRGKATARELWEDIPENSEIEIGSFKFWRDEERLWFFEKVNGTRKDTKNPLLFRSFCKKVTQARKLSVR